MTLLALPLLAALTLPADFDASAAMIARKTDQGELHPVRESAGLAARLLARGDPDDIETAARVLEAVLACQETHGADPHVGNFRWYREDPAVEDLNAVQFVLSTLIPMMIEHRDRLPASTRDRVLASIRLGLRQIERLDVLVAYTNITAKDVTNTCLGGELLGDTRLAERGYRKLREWTLFTARNGATFEYNSPTYSRVTLNTLAQLIKHVRHEETRQRARVFVARLGLSVALHQHVSTGRWAGPHSRAYFPSVIAEDRPELEIVREWLANGTLPAWLGDAIDQRPATLDVVETASAHHQLALTTHLAPRFALGTSLSKPDDQANVLLAHYKRPGHARPGVFYTRYLVNDKWLGDFYHATDRSHHRNLIDEGQFFGVQSGPRAIGFYSPPPLRECHSAKAALIWTGRDHSDEIWINDRRIEQLPVDISARNVVVVASGDVYIAVRPLVVTAIGRDAPLRLVERDDSLVLELHNYLGPKKTFWEMRWPGAFYQGRVQAGFYVEMADRGEFPDGGAFASAIARGTFNEHAAAPFTFAADGERLWTASYARDDHELGLSVDLMRWTLKRRWNESGDLGWPMLESPVARETRDGHIALGGATLACGREAGWLFASAAAGRWIAGYSGTNPAPLTLIVPGGRVELDAITAGTIVWDNGRVTIDSFGLTNPPRISGGTLAPP